MKTARFAERMLVREKIFSQVDDNFGFSQKPFRLRTDDPAGYHDYFGSHVRRTGSRYQGIRCGSFPAAAAAACADLGAGQVRSGYEELFSLMLFLVLNI